MPPAYSTKVTSLAGTISLNVPSGRCHAAPNGREIGPLLEWWAQGGGGGRGGGCFGGDFGDDAATLARAAQWRRENPDLAVRQAEFFHSLWDDPGGAVAKEELLALGLSPDYRHECGICDRDYMLRRGCPCCRD